MPATSQQQQKLFGLALAVKRGEVPASEVSDEVKAIVDRMSEKDIEDFAGTKHDGLPKKVEAQIREMVREIMRERVIAEMSEEPIEEGKKVFKVNPGIGKVKYSISSHDGVKKHKDGSDFFDIETFKNKVDLEKAIKKYTANGFKMESVNEGVSVFDERHFGKNGLIIMIDDNGKKVSAIFKNKKNSYKYDRNNPAHLQALLKVAKTKPFPKAIDEESVNEDASRTAMEIGALTGITKYAIQKFVDDNKLDIEKVFQFVKKGKLKDRLDFATAVVGKVGNPIQKKMVKMFGESINEGASTEEKRIVMMAIKKIAKYRNVSLDYAVGDVIRAAEELEKDIQKGKVK